ncbi:lactonase family protein [Robbsia sp. Bb-Pol-6]|uniref:Lactonase family protein n=1 Tax=Robbsia betulipollinis TaxID=2981849 RepID=A0ABT3ZI67_9BURK|nr:lactonase family protein [Robbsia betulipollinis]
MAIIALPWSVGTDAKPGKPVDVPGTTSAELTYVGTQEQDIRALRFDAATGTLTTIGPVENGLSSTWLVTHPSLPVVYSVDDHTASEGSITAFAVNRRSGALAGLNAQATRAKGTTYLWFDKPSMTLLATNYGSGSVSSYRVNGDGSVGLRISTVTETGSGPNKRQQSAHAHSVAIDPSGHYALVPDLGADRVFIYPFDRATRTLSSSRDDPAGSFTAPPGSGPRHLAFGTNGVFVYLLTELTAQVFVLRWDAAQGRLTPVQSLPISSGEFKGPKSGAEVAVGHDGRFVYVADRGESTLVAYRVDPGSGTLSFVQRVPSGGERPWDFEIDSSGKWMLVANQRSNTMNVFGIDPASGRITDTGRSVAIPHPVSITFVR